MSNKTKTNFISASVKKVLSLSLLVTGGVVMSSMALALLLQDTASSNNEKVQVWGIQSRVQYLTGMTLSWANSDRIKFEYKEDTNALNFNGAMNLHALVIGSTNEGATGSTVIGGNNNVVKWNWQNAAIIGGNKNTVTDTTTSIIAGATGSHITNVQDSAIFSAEGTIIGSDNTTDTMFIVWGKGHVARGRNTNFIAGSENIQTDQNAQNNVLIGKKIRSNQRNIFVWSNGNTELTPQKGSAFYVNSTSGFGLNTNNPQAAFDIANGGLAFNKVYQLSEISDVNIAGVHTVVQKDGKQGVCGYNGSTWVPLTLNAEREGLCTASTQSTPPKHATSTISGAVQFSGQPVITNGTTLLHQVWSGGMNNNHGGWINHPWIYKHTGPLDNGDYRCGIGFHMGNPTPDGMKNTDCKACSPITNQRDWRSNGKNDDCDFSCKAGFKKVGRTCTTCEVGTYTTDGTVANSCASCTNKPANAHYTTNGINANACQWACDAGYYNVGWACKKAVWQKTDTYTCNVAGGIWKDDKIVTTYHCALEENRGVSVPELICNHWGAKPATKIVVKWDINCNPPEWETNRTCPNPSCNTSRIAGKCGGATEAVTCIQHKRDRAWNSYESRTQSQQKACTRVCETALCGGANSVATKYQPTALCAAGTASAVGGNPSIWSWTCAQLDGAKNCSATKIPLQAGSCGSSHNINHNALNAGSANLCNYGSVISFNENGALYTNRWSWKCRGDNGAHNQDVNCIAHKPAPQAGQCAQALNTCTVGTLKDATNIANGKRWSCEGLHGWSTDTTCSLCDNGYIYNSATNRCDPKCGAGYTLHNGVCVKWKCETTPVSTTPWTCRGTYHENTGNFLYEGKKMVGVRNDRCLNRKTYDPVSASCCPPDGRHKTSLPDPKTCRNANAVWMAEDLTSKSRRSPVYLDYAKSEWRWYYACEVDSYKENTQYCEKKAQTEQKSCSGLWDQSSCQSKWCTWTPWTTTPAGTKTVCVDEQWHTRPDNFCTNAGAKPICSVLVNGQCKTHPWFYISQPVSSTIDACLAGDYQDISDDANNRKWKCNGKNGGASIECSARKRPVPPPLNGQCKTYPWTYTSQPATSTANACVAGDYQDISDDATKWRWKCNGKYWGTSTECSAIKQAACPTGFTPSNGKCVKWQCIAASLPPAPGRPPVPGTGKKLWWVKQVSSEMPRGWMSLFSVSAWSFYERSQWGYWSQWGFWPQWPDERSERPEGPKAPEEMPEWPKVHTTQHYQWPPAPHQPQPLPPWLNRIAKCIDDQWNIHPDSLCANAGPKPNCAPSVNGICKPYSWTYVSQPATATANACIAGDYQDIPDASNNWKWKCNGRNWGTATECSAGRQTTNPLDGKPGTVRFIVNCPDYISAIQIEWISKTPNEGPRYDDYYIDLPLVNSNGEMPTSEYPWLKRWYPVLNKIFDNVVRKITIVRDNGAPWKWWAYEINLPSNLIPNNLPEGGRYDIPTMSCLRPGEV